MQHTHTRADRIHKELRVLPNILTYVGCNCSDISRIRFEVFFCRKLAANAEETADPSAQEPPFGLNCEMFCFCNINGVKWTMERVFPLRANEEKLPHFSEDAVSPSLLPERCVSSQPHPSKQRRQD